MAMHRMSNQKACFLSDSTDNLPKLADLKKLIEKVSTFLEVCLFSTSEADDVHVTEEKNTCWVLGLFWIH